MSFRRNCGPLAERGVRVANRPLPYRLQGKELKLKRENPDSLMDKTSGSTSWASFLAGDYSNETLERKTMRATAINQSRSPEFSARFNSRPRPPYANL